MDTAYDVTDYANLRCVDNYTYDSRSIYDDSNYIFYSAESKNYSYYFNGKYIGKNTVNTIIIVGSSTYYDMGFNGNYNLGGYGSYHNIRLVEPRQNIKNFSLF